MPIALVTGATRGLGHALAVDFAKEGYVVYATGRGKDALDMLGKEARGAKLDVRPVRSDVATFSVGAGRYHASTRSRETRPVCT